MKVLVTGSTGGIGSKIVARLLELKYEVVTSSCSDLLQKHISWSGKTSHRPFRIGSDKASNLFSYFEFPDVIIHFAWNDLDDYYADSHMEEQLPAHIAFLKNLVINGASNITVAGTCFEYGLRNGALSEEVLTNPVLPYGRAKDTLRHYLQLIQKKYLFSLKWLRYFNVEGNSSRGHSSLLSLLDVAIRRDDPVFNLSGGEQLRDYLPIEQLVEYSLALSLKDENIGVVNVCSGEPISIRRLVEGHIKELNASIELNFGCYPYPDYEPMAFWGDDIKLRSLLSG